MARRALGRCKRLCAAACAGALLVLTVHGLTRAVARQPPPPAATQRCT
jgi:hypothetical protein